MNAFRDLVFCFLLSLLLFSLSIWGNKRGVGDGGFFTLSYFGVIRSVLIFNRRTLGPDSLSVHTGSLLGGGETPF